MVRLLLATGALLGVSLAACEDSPPIVDDVREDAADRDAGGNAQDSASSDSEPD